LWDNAAGVYHVGKEVLSALNTYVDVKKKLKGKQPKSIKAVDNGATFQITAMSGAVININNFNLRALQSKSLAKSTAKIVQPLLKDDSLLSEIGIKSDDVLTTVNKEDSPYIASIEETQAIEGVKYKGVVSKIDTKTCNGFLDFGSKRLAFSFSKIIDEKSLHILVTSLEKKIQIFLVGNVTMDYEANPVNLVVTKVESEVNLFDN